MSVCRYACLYSSMLVYFQGIDLGGLQSRLLQLSPRGWVCSAVWCEHLLAQARERRRAHPALFYIHCLLSRTVYMADKYEQGQCCPLSLMSKRKWKKKKKKMTGHRLRTYSFFGPETVGDEFHHLSFAVLWPDIRTHVALVTWRAVIQSKWRGNLNGMLEQIAAPLIYSFFQAGRQADKTKTHS